MPDSADRPSLPTSRPADVSRLLGGLFGAGVVVLYLALVEHFIGWLALARSLLAAGPWPAILVVAGLLGSYVLRAQRIKTAEPAIPLDGLPEVIRLFALYNAVNWLLPARLGEASLPLLLQRRYGTPLARGAGVLLWLRLIDLHVVSVLGGLLLAAQGPGPWRWLGTAACAGGLLLPPLCLLGAGWLGRHWRRLRMLGDALPRRANAALGDVALAWAAWLVKLGALGGALSLLSTLAFPAGVLGALGGDIAGGLPLHAPLGAGSYEAGVLLALTPWRPELKAALAAAVQLHALMLASTLLLGGLALPLLGRRPAQAE